MEVVYFSIAVWLVYLCNLVVSSWLSWLLVDWKGPIFHFKPFSCRPCLTFWLTLALGVAAAAILHTSEVVFYLLLALGVLTSFINYYYIKSQINIVE